MLIALNFLFLLLISWNIKRRSTNKTILLHEYTSNKGHIPLTHCTLLLLLCSVCCCPFCSSRVDNKRTNMSQSGDKSGRVPPKCPRLEAPPLYIYFVFTVRCSVSLLLVLCNLWSRHSEPRCLLQTEGHRTCQRGSL